MTVHISNEICDKATSILHLWVCKISHAPELATIFNKSSSPAHPRGALGPFSSFCLAIVPSWSATLYSTGKVMGWMLAAQILKPSLFILMVSSALFICLLSWTINTNRYFSIWRFSMRYGFFYFISKITSTLKSLYTLNPMDEFLILRWPRQYQ